MTKTILLVGLLVALFAVPAFAADATPVTTTPQVVAVSSVDQPVQLTATEMDNTTGEELCTLAVIAIAVGAPIATELIQKGAIATYKYCVSHGVFTKLKNYVNSNWNKLSWSAKAFFTVAHCR